MNIFISGGCKNGKSMHAQSIARNMAEEKTLELYYLATMRATDDEDLSRIARHIEERKGWGFTTIECSENICVCLDSVEKVKDTEKSKGVFLLDSVTALLSNEMFKNDGTIDFHAPMRAAKDLVHFAVLTENTVFVSDYIYGDGQKYDEITETYRKGLAFIDRVLSTICDRVIEVSAGNIIEYKEF